MEPLAVGGPGLAKLTKDARACGTEDQSGKIDSSELCSISERLVRRLPSFAKCVSSKTLDADAPNPGANLHAHSWYVEPASPFSSNSLAAVRVLTRVSSAGQENDRGGIQPDPGGGGR